MASRYVQDLKRKYSVKVAHDIYCTSSTDYFGVAWIIDASRRAKRDVDLMDFRVMHRDSPFTYKGYPQYVIRSIADQFMEMHDKNELSVYEYDRDGNRRYHGLRYHMPDFLELIIKTNFQKYGSK